MRWVREKGTDPHCRNERVTALDYIPAPITKKWAHAVARELGAELVLPETLVQERSGLIKPEACVI